MKHVTKLSLALAAVAAVAVPLALAGNDGPGRTIELVSVQQHIRTVPRANRENPPQVGLRFVFQDVAYNHGEQFGKAAGAVIGRAEGVCTLIALGRQPQGQCLITAHVPDGEIVVAGEGDLGGKITRYAVVGGLGAYAGAQGTVISTALSSTKSLVQIHLD